MSLLLCLYNILFYVLFNCKFTREHFFCCIWLVWFLTMCQVRHQTLLCNWLMSMTLLFCNYFRKVWLTVVYDKPDEGITDCCEQAEKTKEKKVDELLNILQRGDDRLLPLFYDVLIQTHQSHVVEILRSNGLQHTSYDLAFACIIS